MQTEKVQLYFIRKPDVSNFLGEISKKYSTYVPVDVDGIIHYNLFDPEKKQSISLDGIHAVESLKSFFFPALEIMGTYFQLIEETHDNSGKPVAIIGAKSYDIEPLYLFDRIYGEGDFVDPTYVEKRKSTLIIASDCTSFSEACFSPLVGIKLYPERLFDLSIARVKGGYVVTVGSDKGKELISSNPSLFSPAPTEKIAERDENRKKLQKEVEEHNKQYQLSAPYEVLSRKEVDSSVWLDATKTCVECGACVLVCPTCYCFLMSDTKHKEGYKRSRAWDTCQYKGFARVAGGANPRPRLAERLRHRYLHKFDYLKESHDLYACTGCGRCVQACMGKIDMRKVFCELDKAAKQAAHSKAGA